MITDDDLEEGLRSVRSERRAAPPLDDVLYRGRRHARRRRGVQTVLALSVLTAVAAATLVWPDDRGSQVVATRPTGAAHTIEEVSVSRPFGTNLTNMVAGADGTLWAAWAGQGIYRFDGRMQVIRSVEGLEPGVLSQGGFAVADDGSIVVAGTSRGDEVDGHGERISVPTLRSIAPDGTVSTIALLPGQGTLAVPPRVAGGRVFVAISDRVLSVRRGDGGIEASATLGGSINDLILDDDAVWATTGTAVYQLAADGLVERMTERRAANSVAVTGGVAWVQGGQSGVGHRLDGKAQTARGPWGNLFDLEAGDEVLWAYAQTPSVVEGKAGGGQQDAALAAFDAQSGDIVAWRSLGRVYGAMVARGTTAWQQDGLAGGVIRRYELRARAAAAAALTPALKGTDPVQPVA